MSNPDRFEIEAFRHGDESAFKWVYTQFFGSICRFLYKYIADEDRVADLAQDVFVSLWRVRDRFESFDSLRAFLYVAARNRALNELQRDRMRSMRIQAMHRDEAILQSAHLIIDIEVERQLMLSVEQLSAQSRRVLELSLDGKSYREIGERMNLSVHTVKNHRAYAIKVLKRIFGKD